MYRIDLDLARIRVPVSPLTTGYNTPCVEYDCVPHIALHSRMEAPARRRLLGITQVQDPLLSPGTQHTLIDPASYPPLAWPV